MVPLVAVLEAAAIVLLIVNLTTELATWPAAIVLAVGATVVLLFRRIVVTADRAELRVRYAAPMGRVGPSRESSALRSGGCGDPPGSGAAGGDEEGEVVHGHR